MLHNFIHIALALGIVFGVLTVVNLRRETARISQALLTALTSQAQLLKAIVEHIENDKLSEFLESQNVEGAMKH